jgi:hypothetical protein
MEITNFYSPSGSQVRSNIPDAATNEKGEVNDYITASPFSFDGEQPSNLSGWN